MVTFLKHSGSIGNKNLDYLSQSIKYVQEDFILFLLLLLGVGRPSIMPFTSLMLEWTY